MSDGSIHRPSAARPARVPLWPSGLALALLFLGFHRSRHQGPRKEGLSTLHNPERHWEGPVRPSALRRWTDVLRQTLRNVSRHRVFANAAGVAFYAILAVFPALAALVAIYGLFADPQAIGNHLAAIAGVAPEGAIEVMKDQLTRVASQGGRTLGFAFAVGLLVSLWSANAGIKALFDALNVVYGQQEKRSFRLAHAVSLIFTLGAIGLVLLALCAVAVVPLLLDFVGLSNAADVLLRIARWPVLLIVTAFGLALLYRYGPSRGEGHIRSLTWGSGFAALGWLAVSILVFLVCREFWPLQSDIRLPGRDHRLHGMDLDFRDRHPGRRRTRRSARKPSHVRSREAGRRLARPGHRPAAERAVRSPLPGSRCDPDNLASRPCADAGRSRSWQRGYRGRRCQSPSPAQDRHFLASDYLSAGRPSIRTTVGPTCSTNRRETWQRPFSNSQLLPVESGSGGTMVSGSC